jgi:hypothetical protein
MHYRAGLRREVSVLLTWPSPVPIGRRLRVQRVALLSRMVRPRRYWKAAHARMRKHPRIASLGHGNVKCSCGANIGRPECGRSWGRDEEVIGRELLAVRVRNLLQHHRSDCRFPRKTRGLRIGRAAGGVGLMTTFLHDNKTEGLELHLRENHLMVEISSVCREEQPRTGQAVI